MAVSQYAQNLVFNGLGTISVTVPAAGIYTVKGKISLPTLTNGGGVSQLVATVNQNGSPVYTGVAGASGFGVQVTCAVNDVIAVVFSSAAAPDQGFNVIKSNITIFQGE